MSTKFRNEERPGFMRNFSKFVIERYILIDDDSLNENEKDLFVSEVNEALWLAIQETNIIAKNRILPFVTVRRVVEVNNELRIIINDIESKHTYDDYNDEFKPLINIDKLSHVINFKSLPTRRQIEVSDHLIPGNAKMLVSRANQIAAAVDIFLDIAMFHSIDFLHNMTLEQKQNFSKMKFDYANSNNLMSFYKRNYSNENPPTYWSFAFSARKTCKDIDYYEYVSLWNMFIKSKFSDKIINARPINPPQDQLKYHTDKDNIDKIFFTEEFWSKLESGDYLFVRTNREPNDNERKLYISNWFSIPKFHLGAIKVIPIGDYNQKYFYTQMKELYVSAFKIVV